MRNRSNRLTVFFLAIAFAGAVPGPAADDGAIRLRSGVVRGPGDPAGIASSMRMTAADLADGGPALLKFAAPLTPGERDAAGRLGIDLGIYVGDRSYIVDLAAAAVDRLSLLPQLSWSTPYHPGLRIDPELSAVAAAGATGTEDADDAELGTLVLTVHLFPHASSRDIAARLEREGFEVLGILQGSRRAERRAARLGRVVVAAPAAEWTRLASLVPRWDEVVWIDRKPSYDYQNNGSAWVGQSGVGQNFATPLYDHGLLGEGQVIGVFDSGVDVDSCYFRDDVFGPPAVQEGLGVGTPDPGHRKILIYDFLWDQDDPADPADWDNLGHGTHTTGSAAGDVATTPGARDSGDGMAPAAKLVIQDTGYDPSPCGSIPVLGCGGTDVAPFFDQAYQQGARLHNNSYGSSDLTPPNQYSIGSESADAFVWDHPEFFISFSAGNLGPGAGTVTSPSTAKNVVAIGATMHGANADTLVAQSSRGPALDGRLKPDLTAPGFGIVSAQSDGNVNSNNCGQAVSSGTSMSSPTVVGLAALMREYFEKGFYPGGSASAPDGFAPSAALLKAALIASARSMANEPAAAPSTSQGWGRPVLDNVLYFAGDAKRIFLQDVADAFDSPADPTQVHTVQVLDGGEPLRVVLAWTDYPSNTIAAVNLVNDLNLEVESPGGAVYLGNVFAGGASTTGGSADSLNNVEAVRIEAPEPGPWTIRVAPAAIPEAGQGYALVATGRIPAAGVLLERLALPLDDSVGGNADGILDPGEWVDLPLSLMNGGESVATNVSATVEALTAGVQVIQPAASFADLPTGSSATADAPHLRIRLPESFVCTDSLTLRLTYAADGALRTEDVTLPTGSRSIFSQEDFEGATAWQHFAIESDATQGNWIVGDPEATGFQPGDDATPGSGTRCLYTAANPGGGIGTNDVDSGVVVARSGTHDLSSHPEARLSVQRWYANRDIGEDPNDFFRLEIRESNFTPDVLLEEIDFTRSEPQWIEVTFRVADFIIPSTGVRLKAKAQDGFGPGSIIEAAIDEVLFWDPVCDVHDPIPNPVVDLAAERSSGDLVLSWSTPPLDPAHGEVSVYTVFRSNGPAAGFAEIAAVAGAGESYADSDALGNPFDLYYLVVSANSSGPSEPLP